MRKLWPGADDAGTSTYTYDTAGRLATLTDAASAVQAAYTYNTLNQVSQIKYGNANTRTLGYDALHRLTTDTLKTTGGATVAASASATTPAQDDNHSATITTTYHHPFYNLTQTAFTDAINLHPGDHLQTPTGTQATVLSVTPY